MPGFITQSVIYKTIDRFEGYRFGSDGSIWTCMARVGPRGSKLEVTDRWKKRTATNNGMGYLYVGINGRNIYAHILILEAFRGPRPKGFQACHNDGNRQNNCILNLRWDTVSNNHKDKVLHGTSNRGERAASAKLKETQVIEIRNSPHISNAEFARRFGILRSYVWAIRKGKSWKHVSLDGGGLTADAPLRALRRQQRKQLVLIG